MRPRYLLLVSQGEDLAARAARIATATGLRVCHRTPRIAVLANEDCCCLAIDVDHLVVGTLFHRHGPPRAIAAFDDTQRSALLNGGAATLLASYWGGYISLSVRGDAVEILRDPSGALPCYRAAAAGTALFASDIELLSASGAVNAGVGWDALGRMLFSSGLPTLETALVGIGMILAGTTLVLDGHREETVTSWSPWDFAEPAGEDSAAASDRLRRAIEQSVSAWTSRYRHPLLSVSGGLDSSIVAACLARSMREQSGSAASCITLYTDDPAGDERGYARQVCAPFDLPLAECRYTLDAVDLGRALGAHLPRPAGRVEAQPYEAAHRAISAQVGADAFFTGNGGDNVFNYSQSAAALADRALREGPGAGAFATLRDICRQTGAGPLRVTRAAMRIARGAPGYRWRASPALLHPEVIASLQELAFAHPWLEAPPGALPGKAAHIAGLLRAQVTLEPDRCRVAPVVHPLLSQPVVETCLSIPSWQWRSGGRDRAVARDAFVDRLPQAILDRKSKGTPDPFCGEIVARKRGELRARLLDGQLAAHRLLDQHAIEETLRPERPTTGEENVRLLELANVEAWLSSWT